MLNDAQVAAIRQRAEAATPGPWFEYHTMDSGDWTVQVARGWVFVASDKGTGEDAAFVAHARADIPELLSGRDELVRRLATLEVAARRLVSELDNPNWPGNDDAIHEAVGVLNAALAPAAPVADGGAG